ncbi:hypothetical protein [Kaistella carnis]|uniref:hypothetical protein n=1 Tax=Kaistella carnis TaxID=1241979 RepID=UPI0028A735BD|nr:hypothetical protein [Kaistella carnis]
MKRRIGKATGGLVQHGISIIASEVPTIKTFDNCSICFTTKTCYKSFHKHNCPTLAVIDLQNNQKMLHK